MRNQLKNAVKYILPNAAKDFIKGKLNRLVPIHVEPDSWFAAHLPYSGTESVHLQALKKIEAIAQETQRQGSFPLWQGYPDGGNHVKAPHSERKRSSEQVRTNNFAGQFFVWLAVKRRPRTIIEFGTAFGVSGMYWLTGLQANCQGTLYTFEPNEIWAEVARRNLDRIGSRYKSFVGTFEEHYGPVIEDPGIPIDICFIDAIHTRAFVEAQLELVLKRTQSQSIILFDDINFSQDMQACWASIAKRPVFSATLELGNIGIAELR